MDSRSNEEASMAGDGRSEPISESREVTVLGHLASCSSRQELLVFSESGGSLGVLQQSSDEIHCKLCKNHSGFCVKNTMKGYR